MSERRYWLMKTEPDAYSIDDLARERQASWDGVRNFKARNFMRDDMKVGDLVLFYHSSVKPPGVVGLARVCREAYPDHTAWEPDSKYRDPRSRPEKPIWHMVDLEFVEKFADMLTLDAIKATDDLDGMKVRIRGMRLSVQPVERHHFEAVLRMAGSAHSPD